MEYENFCKMFFMSNFYIFLCRLEKKSNFDSVHIPNSSIGKLHNYAGTKTVNLQEIIAWKSDVSRDCGGGSSSSQSSSNIGSFRNFNISQLSTF